MNQPPIPLSDNETDLNRSSIEARSAMIDAMIKAGIRTVDGTDVIADGKWHRYRGVNHKASSRNIAVKLHNDHGYAKDWRSGLECTWVAKPATWTSSEERDAYRQRVASEHLAAHGALQAKHDAAAELAAQTWKRALAANPKHPYLVAKGISSGPARQGPNGELMLKIEDLAGRIRSLQYINGTGRKKLAKDGAKQGNFIVVAGSLPAETILIGEGFATMASVAAVAQAYRVSAVIAAIDAGNLLPVARAMRESCPSARIVVCADNDVATPGNPGRTKACEAARAVDGVVALPCFEDTCEGTDWNDYARVARWHGRMLATLDAAAQFAAEDDAFEATLAAEYGDGFAREAIGMVTALVERAKSLGTQPSLAQSRRTILIAPGELPRVVDMAEEALLQHCSELFQRAGTIVRPVLTNVDVADGRRVETVRLVPVNKHHLAERMTAAAQWQRFDGRARREVDIDAPLKVAETYLSREGSWRLPYLAGVVNAPTLRGDGSVLDRIGYDPSSGLLFEPGGSAFPAIPLSPSKGEAAAALARLEKLIETFPFVSAHDRSVALSAILTTCIRRSLPTAPMHAFSAPVAGSGKSMLVDIASIIACGRRAAVLSQGRDEAETEKRIGAALLAGDQVISIDNATLPIDGDLLCQVCTQPTVRIRPLGISELRDVPTNASMFATGNGLVIQGDMTRRVLLCALDPQCEQPEKRQFASTPSREAALARPEFLRDALIVLRAFHVVGRPHQVAPLGSFEEWSNWVRSALLWLDRPDPVKTMDRARQGDPQLEALRAVIHAWHDAIGRSRITAADLIRKATEQVGSPGVWQHRFVHDELREALLSVAGHGGVINSRALGRWLATHQGRIVDGMLFEQVGKSHGVALWALRERDRSVDFRMELQ